MTKRSLSLSQIDECQPSADIEGVLSVVSPLKKSKKSHCSYFDGELTDGKTSIRIVGFDAEEIVKPF